MHLKQSGELLFKLYDISTCFIDVNLWGPSWQEKGVAFKQMHLSGDIVIVVVWGGRVGYFNEKFINTPTTIVLNINPSILEAKNLRSTGLVKADVQDECNSNSII